jgi:hypothetical protein
MSEPIHGPAWLDLETDLAHLDQGCEALVGSMDVAEAGWGSMVGFSWCPLCAMPVGEES